jgi:hypothetical protein
MNRQHIVTFLEGLGAASKRRVLILIAAVLIIATGCDQAPTALPALPTETSGAEATATAPKAEPTMTEPPSTHTSTPEPTPTTAPSTPTPVAEDEGTPIEGWVGTVRDLPAGNQFGQVFIREDGEDYDIGATNDAAWDVIMEAKESGAQLKIWGTLYTGVPASEARHIDVERVSVVATPPDEGTAVEGWTGTLVKLPPGNQFGQFFIRENGEQYTISATQDEVRTQIADAAWTGAQLKVWGTLYTGVPATEARHLEIEQVEVGSPASEAPRYLSPFAEVRASSELHSDRYGSYFPYAAIDGQLETAWVEGVEGPGLGEWIELRFPEAVEVHAIHVDVGFDESAELFTKNNRVREATLRFSDGQSATVTFEDVRGMQPVSVVDLFDGPVATTSVELVIEAVTPGSAYDDTCIAEIEVYGLTQ